MLDGVVVKIVSTDGGTPRGKLADAELQFTTGPLEGLRLLGFAVWEARDDTAARRITFPAREYTLNGERRRFNFLRPIVDAEAQERVRDALLQAYAEYEEQLAEQRATGAHSS